MHFLDVGYLLGYFEGFLDIFKLYIQPGDLHGLIDKILQFLQSLSQECRFEPSSCKIIDTLNLQ